MTNEQAIEHLKIIDSRYPSSLESTFNDECERIALNMAIKALEERPEGKWVEKEETPASVSYYCSNCECAGLGVENFCSWCGATMEREE